ncbi:MAG: T9SS type A sorting domain-containing protein [Phycisphaerae bacterium]|nr:T9SS type A sorting domain-containing protein [Saprospiraceae bacterium]
MFQKSVFTLLFLSSFATLAFAQPVIQNTIIPDIGDVVKLTVADTLNVSEGNAGANQTWNFSNWHILSGTTPTQYRYISPVGTPYFANYPSATMATKVEEDTVIYVYFREESNKYSLLGAASIAFQQSYTDPDAQLKYPTNYNASYLEDFAYTTDAGTGVNFYSKGSRTVKYDAYGTLITPLGTFQNAMRIKAVSSQIDSAEFMGIKIINHSFLTTYGWLAAGHPGTLASVYYSYTVTETYFPGIPTIIDQSPVTKSVNYVSSSSVGVFDLVQAIDGISALTLGPNPAMDQLTLRFESNIAMPSLQLRITDASGRLLQTQALDASIGENVMPLAVGHIPSGNYFLTLTDGRGVQTLNWVKY